LTQTNSRCVRPWERLVDLAEDDLLPVSFWTSDSSVFVLNFEGLDKDAIEGEYGDGARKVEKRDADGAESGDGKMR
jgi:hypothetical protein